MIRSAVGKREIKPFEFEQASREFYELKDRDVVGALLYCWVTAWLKL